MAKIAQVVRDVCHNRIYVMTMQSLRGLQQISNNFRC